MSFEMLEFIRRIDNLFNNTNGGPLPSKMDGGLKIIAVTLRTC